jgi:hypothetical protein
MSPTTLELPKGWLAINGRQSRARDSEAEPQEQKGFGGPRAGKGGKRKGAGKRHSALSKADWGPLGKHPDLEAILARQQLHLPLSGRLTEAQVNQAWKGCAAEHHPDRGGENHNMQRVNGARDLLLGRDRS